MGRHPQSPPLERAGADIGQRLHTPRWRLSSCALADLPSEAPGPGAYACRLRQWSRVPSSLSPLILWRVPGPTMGHPRASLGAGHGRLELRAPEVRGLACERGDHVPGRRQAAAIAGVDVVVRRLRQHGPHTRLLSMLEQIADHLRIDSLVPVVIVLVVGARLADDVRLVEQAAPVRQLRVVVVDVDVVVVDRVLQLRQVRASLGVDLGQAGKRPASSRGPLRPPHRGDGRAQPLHRTGRHTTAHLDDRRLVGQVSYARVDPGVEAPQSEGDDEHELRRSSGGEGCTCSEQAHAGDQG